MAEGVSKPDFAPWRGARPIAGGERSEPPELEIGEKSPGRGETILSFALFRAPLYSHPYRGLAKSARPRLIVLRPSGAASLDIGFAAISAARPYETTNGWAHGVLSHPQMLRLSKFLAHRHHGPC